MTTVAAVYQKALAWSCIVLQSCQFSNTTIVVRVKKETMTRHKS